MSKDKVIDLTKKDTQFEIASVQDADLMKIRCFATHEGENLNGTIFPPKVLINCYRTFIDKPVVIVPDSFNNPTGHGYDYKKQTFKNDKRVNVGHIVNAFPVMVSPDEEIIEVYGVEDLDREEFNDYELRIVADIVIYKHYLYDIAERLKLLHEMGGLSFSMESVVDCYVTEDDKRVCTDISFTGLAIVDKPAFTRAKSIEVAGQKGDEDMEFKEMYEAEVQKSAELAEKVKGLEEANETLKSEKSDLETQIAEVKEELANSKQETSNALAEVESLKPFKEQVENAEKEALGKERAAKLEKFGVKDVDVAELAEMSAVDFADKLVEAADNAQTIIAEDESHSAMGIPQHNPSASSNKDKLVKALAGLMNE